MMGIAENLRARLAEVGMTQTELARRIGITQSTVASLLSGKSQGSKHLHLIARVLETTPAFLLGETEDSSEGALPTSLLAEQFGMRMIPDVDIAYSMGGGSIVEEQGGCICKGE